MYLHLVMGHKLVREELDIHLFRKTLMKHLLLHKMRNPPHHRLEVLLHLLLSLERLGLLNLFLRNQVWTLCRLRLRSFLGIFVVLFFGPWVVYRVH